MTSDEHEIIIWDLPTRIFHWMLVVLVGTNLFLISPRSEFQILVHFVTGYSVAGLILFLTPCGFVGSPRSRFVDFLHGWPVVKRYTCRLLRLDPPSCICHDPLRGWTIVLIIATL